MVPEFVTCHKIFCVWFSLGLGCLTSLRLAFATLCHLLHCISSVVLWEPHVTNLLLAEDKLGTWPQGQSRVRRGPGSASAAATRTKLQNETLALFCPAHGPCWSAGSREVWENILRVWEFTKIAPSRTNMKKEWSKSWFYHKVNISSLTTYPQVWQEQQ